MYSHIAQSYNQLHGQEQTRKFSLLTQHIILSDYKNVADIGCATTHISKYFTDASYVGVDPCQELLKQAPKNVRTICSRGENLLLETNKYDLVLSLTALHNYDDPLTGVQELARICSDTALIGVLKKSPYNAAIIECIKKYFVIIEHIRDQHDDLFVVSVRNV